LRWDPTAVAFCSTQHAVFAARGAIPQLVASGGSKGPRLQAPRTRNGCLIVALLCRALAAQTKCGRLVEQVHRACRPAAVEASNLPDRNFAAEPGGPGRLDRQLIGFKQGGGRGRQRAAVAARTNAAAGFVNRVPQNGQNGKGAWGPQPKAVVRSFCCSVGLGRLEKGNTGWTGCGIMPAPTGAIRS